MEQLLKLQELIQQYAPPVVIYGLMGLGALVVCGYAYIQVTPSKEDDAWLQKMESKPVLGAVLRFLVSFSPVQRK